MFSTSIEYLLQELCINHHLLHKNYIIIASVKQFAGLFRQILHITYLARKIATKAIESVQACKQQRAPVSQKAVKTKQLSLRLAGEWFGIPNTTLYRHVLKKYAKFGAGRAAFGAGGQKHIAQSCQLLPQQASGFNMPTYA